MLTVKLIFVETYEQQNLSGTEACSRFCLDLLDKGSGSNGTVVYNRDCQKVE